MTEIRQWRGQLWMRDEHGWVRINRVLLHLRTGLGSVVAWLKRN